MSTLSSTITSLADTFSGQLLQAADAGYDGARRVHNGLIDKHPAVIAQCLGIADIADAVRLAREHGLEVSVRGGGHNVAGRAVTDGGVMIDLSGLRSVHVDAGRRTARAGGGAIWRDFNRETQAFGLATTGGVVGSTGVGGLTLGGGLGWLMPKYGMALDNLLSADVVLADGTIVRAADDENEDLFWAVRGGGGNFGVAGSFQFRLHDVGPTLIGGMAAWPFEHARDVLRFFRDFTRRADDDVMAFAGLLTAPDGQTKLAAIVVGHFGPANDGQAAVAPIKRFGAPIVDGLGPIDYSALNGMLDAAFPRGAMNYWKTHFLDELSDDAIDALIAQYARSPTPMSQVLLEHFHGAASRVPVADTAYALRSEGYNSLVLAQWTDAVDNERCIDWARQTYTSLQPFVGAQRYVNYLDDDDSDDTVLSSVYGPNLARLRKIKKQYDPDNVFHMNVNITPE
jgi:hypothetical protein